MLCTLLLVTAASASAKTTTGPWSDAVNGVQGRVSISEDPKYNSTRIVAVYLELRNVSNLANPIEIYFDPIRIFKCELIDSNGKSVATAGLPADILSPIPFWLALPYVSSLRFRISVSGYGVPKDGGTLVPMDCGEWLLKANDRAKYFLKIKFVARTTEEDFKRSAWKGSITLPKVRIPR